jgi:hypothetical protein
MFSGAALSMSNQIQRIREKNMLQPLEEGGRKYVIRFDNNYLLRGIIRMLDQKGFLPIQGEME